MPGKTRVVCAVTPVCWTLPCAGCQAAPDCYQRCCLGLSVVVGFYFFLLSPSFIGFGVLLFKWTGAGVGLVEDGRGKLLCNSWGVSALG